MLRNDNLDVSHVYRIRVQGRLLCQKVFVGARPRNDETLMASLIAATEKTITNLRRKRVSRTFLNLMAAMRVVAHSKDLFLGPERINLRVI